MRKLRAFTLIEIIAVIGILAVLGALLFPVLVRARDETGGTVLISNLHQVSVAWTIYDPDDVDPSPSIVRLYDSGLVKNDILFSPRDPYPYGEGTMLRLCRARRLVQCGGAQDRFDLAGSSRSSIVSYDDITQLPDRPGTRTYDINRARADGATNLGYFAAYTTFPKRFLPFYSGGRVMGDPLLRVLPDGAVVRRRLIGRRLNNSTDSILTHTGSIFYDLKDWE